MSKLNCNVPILESCGGEELFGVGKADSSLGDDGTGDRNHVAFGDGNRFSQSDFSDFEFGDNRDTDARVGGSPLGLFDAGVLSVALGGLDFFYDGLDHRVGNTDLELFIFVADRDLGVEGHEDGIWGGGLEEAATGFVADKFGAEGDELILPEFRPFGDDQMNDIFDEGEFDFGEASFFLGDMAFPSEESIGHGEAEGDTDFDDADSAEGIDLKEGHMGGIFH